MIFLAEMLGSVLTFNILNRVVLGPLFITFGFALFFLQKPGSVKNLIAAVVFISIGFLMIWYKLKAIKREDNLE
jgi:hypothetical protein